MSAINDNCLVCGRLNTPAKPAVGKDAFQVSCGACGDFEMTRSAAKSSSEVLSNPYFRAVVAHELWKSASPTKTITSAWLAQIENGVRLPNPMVQANNLIKLIGDKYIATGELWSIEDSSQSRIGSFSTKDFRSILIQLESLGLIQRTKKVINLLEEEFLLTLAGWDKYQKEKRGKLSLQQGFMAMKFADAQLDALVSEHVKPHLKNRIGYELVDLRDVARAGIIDNIMREQIRDSAFVIADLTHDNRGAYWEAGYAEGLGKPVVYICRSDVFENEKTKPHFDINHCTILRWESHDQSLFLKDLVATLRRSLNLFANDENE